MSALPLLHLIDAHTPAQKLAVYDFCRLMSEILWQRYEDVLLEEMMRIDHDNGFDHLNTEAGCNLELPFDDEITF